MTENSATMRTCRRAAARPRRLAWNMLHSSRTMNKVSSSTVTALPASSVTTTSCVGAIGVRSASTTKGTRAESKAMATAARPSERANHPGAGAVATLADSAAGTCSAVETWPTLVMYLFRPKSGNCPDAPTELVLLYHNVAELRQFKGNITRCCGRSAPHHSAPPHVVSCRRGIPEYPDRGFSCAMYFD